MKMTVHSHRGPFFIHATTAAVVAVALAVLPDAAVAATANNTDATRIAEATQPDAATLSASASTTSVLVADAVELKLVARAANGVHITFPPAPETLGEFQVTKSEDVFDIPDGAKRTWTRTLTLESFTAGTHTISEFTVNYSGTGVEPGTISSRPVTVEVGSVLAASDDPTQFRDIKGVVSLAEPVPASNAYICWTLGCLIAGGFVTWFMIRRRNQALTAAQWALCELDRTKSSNLIAEGRTDAFYCRMTDIIRYYIERAFDVRSPRLTTAEFFTELQQSGHLLQSRKQLLHAFLETADQVKFAQYWLAEDTATGAIELAKDFVRDTASGTEAAKTRSTTTTKRPTEAARSSKQLTASAVSTNSSTAGDAIATATATSRPVSSGSLRTTHKTTSNGERTVQ